MAAVLLQMYLKLKNLIKGVMLVDWNLTEMKLAILT